MRLYQVLSYLGCWGLVVVVMAGALQGCGSQSTPPSNPNSVAEAAKSSHPQSALVAQAAVDYVKAIDAGDFQRVEQLISQELRERIAQRGPGSSYEDHITAYTNRERNKLERVRNQSRAPLVLGQQIDVQALKMTTIVDESVFIVTLAVDNVELAKPLYVVLEDGAYRLNVVPPSRSNLSYSVSQYRVENKDAVPRSFSCSGYGSYGIGPTPTQRYINCEDSCRAWWFFDGTTFTIGAAAADCDYNTWGTDMFIVGGFPICNDPC